MIVNCNDLFGQIILRAINPNHTRISLLSSDGDSNNGKGRFQRFPYI